MDSAHHVHESQLTQGTRFTICGMTWRAPPIIPYTGAGRKSHASGGVRLSVSHASNSKPGGTSTSRGAGVGRVGTSMVRKSISKVHNSNRISKSVAESMPNNGNSDEMSNGNSDGRLEREEDAEDALARLVRVRDDLMEHAQAKHKLLAAVSGGRAQQSEMSPRHPPRSFLVLTM